MSPIDPRSTGSSRSSSAPVSLSFLILFAVTVVMITALSAVQGLFVLVVYSGQEVAYKPAALLGAFIAAAISASCRERPV